MDRGRTAHREVYRICRLYYGYGREPL